MNRLTLATAAVLLVAGQLGAQSTPPITRAKLVAQNAVNQTNAQTTAMTSVADTVPPGEQPVIAPPQVRNAPIIAPESQTKRVESSAGSIAVAPTFSGFQREVFYYEGRGRRDPFTSLMSSSDLRPLISDLKLVAVAYDATGRNSVAVLRDLNTKQQYR
ncbi:MAG: hypothetical protein ABI877_17735, partial [Gemmatimonadaceae bacterium]